MVGMPPFVTMPCTSHHVHVSYNVGGALAGSQTAGEAKQPTAHAWALRDSSRRRHRERTAEERVQDVRRVVLDMQREIASSAFYRRVSSMSHNTPAHTCLHACT